jgi:hypothetical protein
MSTFAITATIPTLKRGELISPRIVTPPRHASRGQDPGSAALSVLLVIFGHALGGPLSLDLFGKGA